ncbi:MAG TPA: NADPH-dependent F420 reductase [Nitrososphaera sp.]|nr:NADPH-dependent F420 reductase [Nitrososphaera sp.]
MHSSMPRWYIITTTPRSTIHEIQTGYNKSRPMTLITRSSNDDSMKIGIAGGTGGMGEGFALRWCQKHDVIVGSRDAQKAREAAENYTLTAKGTYSKIDGSITGSDNISFTNDIDVLILSIPYEYIDDTCGKLRGKLRDDCVVVSPIVPMARTDAGFVYIPLEEGKKQAAEMVADKLPPRSRVVSAFHTISESKLKKLEQSLDADTFICGDDQAAITKLTELIHEISGLRPIYLGPLALTYQAEILTPMCLNAAKRNKMKNPGVKLV